MPPRPNPKYRAPKSHFAKRPPLTPAPAYTAPLQWTPPSSPALPNMPLPSLPPYSLPEPEPPVLRWSPLEEPLSRPNLLPTFRANHPSPRLTPLPLSRTHRHLTTQPRSAPRSRPPPRHIYLRRETLLLYGLLVLQLAVLVILGTVLIHSDWRRCGGGLEQPTLSTGPEGAVFPANSDSSQSTTPEP